MYLHLGADVVINKNSIIGIFDLDTSTAKKTTREYLSEATEKDRVVNVSDELPRSFIVSDRTGEPTVYISQISSQTLAKRCLRGAVSEV